MNYGRVVGGVGQCQSFTPALAASAMAMIVSRESNFEIVTFAKDKELKHVTIDSSMSLDEIKGRIFEVRTLINLKHAMRDSIIYCIIALFGLSNDF
jgi:hypothetical protein